MAVVKPFIHPRLPPGFLTLNNRYGRGREMSFN